MHRVLLQLVVLFIAGVFLPGAVSGQGILEGEFGAAKQSNPKATAPANASASVSEADAQKVASTSKRYPYHGKLELVDPEGRSITLAGKTRQRVILITSSTNITRDGRRVTLKEALKGEKVSGSVIKNEEGREQALTLRLRGLQ